MLWAFAVAVSIAAGGPCASAQGRRTVPPGPPPPPNLPPTTRPVPGGPSASRPDPAKSKSRLFLPQDLGLLEPSDRDQWQPPDQIMDALNIADGAVVADLGAGGGWFTMRLAQRIGPNGVVYAEDVQSVMLEGIRRRAQRENRLNVRTVLGTANDPLLPRGIDAALIVGSYHEMACGVGPTCQDPIALLKNVARSLKPQGLLGVVDFNPGEGGPGPAADERVDPEAVVRAAAAAGFQVLKREAVPRDAAPSYQFQFLLVFGKNPGARPAQ
jgi:predicted methyltransferase